MPVPAKGQPDRVRIALPIEVYGNTETRRDFARILGKRLKPYGLEVAERSDTGVIVTGHYARGVGGTPAGALAAGAAVATTVERELDRLATTSAARAALEDAIRYAVIKVNVTR